MFNPLDGLDFGSRGVDVFFVISGFIMYTAARDEPVVDFVWRRLIRIVPLYWAATLATFAVRACLAPSANLNAEVAMQLAKSLAFIPHYSPTAPGFIWPYLVPGWTLNFEMFFYAIFALAIGLKRPLAVTGGIISLLVVLGIAAHPSHAALKTYTDPIMLEFFAGVVIGALYQRFTFKGLDLLLPVGVLALLLFDLVTIPALRLPYAAGAAIAILTGALALERRKVRLDSKILKLLGDASYSIYLSHTAALIFFFRLWYHIPLTGWPQFIGVVTTGLALASAGGVVIHLIVERPMLRYLRSRGPQRAAA